MLPSKAKALNFSTNHDEREQTIHNDKIFTIDYRLLIATLPNGEKIELLASGKSHTSTLNYIFLICPELLLLLLFAGFEFEYRKLPDTFTINNDFNGTLAF